MEEMINNFVKLTYLLYLSMLGLWMFALRDSSLFHQHKVTIILWIVCHILHSIYLTKYLILSKKYGKISVSCTLAREKNWGKITVGLDFLACNFVHVVQFDLRCPSCLTVLQWAQLHLGLTPVQIKSILKLRKFSKHRIKLLDRHDLNLRLNQRSIK